jgi:hypothetical protein
MGGLIMINFDKGIIEVNGLESYFDPVIPLFAGLQ